MVFEFEQGQLLGFHAGQTRSEIEELFGERPVQFMKTPFSTSLTDAYCDESVHVYFNETDVMKGVEVMRPNVFLCFERNVLGERARTVTEFLSSNDASFSEDDLGYWLYDRRLALYVPDKGDHPDVLVKAVYVSYEDDRIHEAVR
ncbi:hypothetical protein [Luteibacter sp. RCC_6_2]|uniref:hypothetical protein n=1 Tax=Luteibacter sp. RCC_6_2 TaxID=3239223 RepID=UPI0035240233